MQTNTFFREKKSSELRERLEKSLDGFSIGKYSHLVKGDVSGIQDFIFSVKSDKASKSLKGRSFFVQALSKLSIRLLEEKLGENNTEVFYDGGGNFYLLSKVPVAEAVAEAQKVIDTQCREEEIYLSLTWTGWDGQAEPDFQPTWKKLNQESTRAKLRKFSGTLTLPEKDWQTFSPYHYQESDEAARKYEFDKLTNLLKASEGQYFIAPVSESGKSVGANGVTFFDGRLRPASNGIEKFEDLVIALPQWSPELRKQFKEIVSKRKKEDPEFYDEGIVEFSMLAAFANTRTGTEKLAVLKMDVDNLGKLFGGLQDWQDAKRASAAMSWFFGAFMSDLLNESFENKDNDGNPQTSRYSDNIYVVFSGGDDTFMVGAWDAVFEFAHYLHQNFSDFTAELQMLKINGLPPKITLSAALVVVDPKFPVVGFAELAEEALSDAKRWENEKGERCKNKISVFGQILEWAEFDESRKIGQYLADMIQARDVSRSIIERIKGIAYDYERLAERAAEKQHVPGPKVHRLYYTLKKWIPRPDKEENSKSQNEKFIEKTAHDFTNGLLLSFTTKQKVSYPKFPVAARWAEFLTRK